MARAAGFASLQSFTFGMSCQMLMGMTITPVRRACIRDIEVVIIDRGLPDGDGIELIGEPRVPRCGHVGPALTLFQQPRNNVERPWCYVLGNSVVRLGYHPPPTQPALVPTGSGS